MSLVAHQLTLQAGTRTLVGRARPHARTRRGARHPRRQRRRQVDAADGAGRARRCPRRDRSRSTASRSPSCRRSPARSTSACCRRATKAASSAAWPTSSRWAIIPFGAAAADLTPQLATWELTDLARRPLDTLSGGERQRARLAQLAAQQPRIALLDEPLTHLDPAHQARLLAWARGEADAGRSVVLTLHDPNWAACHCDRLLFLYGDGRWRLGTPADLLTPASLEALYGPGTAALWQKSDRIQPV